MLEDNRGTHQDREPSFVERIADRFPVAIPIEFKVDLPPKECADRLFSLYKHEGKRRGVQTEQISKDTYRFDVSLINTFGENWQSVSIHAHGTFQGRESTLVSGTCSLSPALLIVIITFSLLLIVVGSLLSPLTCFGIVILGFFVYSLKLREECRARAALVRETIEQGAWIHFISPSGLNTLRESGQKRDSLTSLQDTLIFARYTEFTSPLPIQECSDRLSDLFKFDSGWGTMVQKLDDQQIYFELVRIIQGGSRQLKGTTDSVRVQGIISIDSRTEKTTIKAKFSIGRGIPVLVVCCLLLTSCGAFSLLVPATDSSIGLITFGIFWLAIGIRFTVGTWLDYRRLRSICYETLQAENP